MCRENLIYYTLLSKIKKKIKIRFDSVPEIFKIDKK